MADMFGAPIGDLAAGQEARLQSATDSLNRLHTAHSASLEQQTSQNTKMMQILSGGGDTPAPADGDPLSMATSKLASDAARLINAGLPNQGAKLAEAAAGLVLHKQQTLTAAAQESYRKNQAQEAVLTDMNYLLAGVTDQASLNQAKMIFMSQHPEVQKIPPAFSTYSPELIETVRNGTKAGLAKLAEDRKELDADSRIEARDSLDEFRKDRLKIYQANLKVRQQEADRRAKAAGDKISDPGAPTKAETDQAVLLVNRDYPNLPPTEKSQAAFDVASRAKQLRKSHAGLDASAAMEQALEEGRDAFSTLDKTFLGLKTGSETRYKAKKADDTPIALPPDKTKLSLGKVYNTAKGPARWNGQNFTPVGKPAAARAPVAALPDDEEED